MGAAATALPRRSTRTKPAPEWQSETLPKLDGKFSQVPNAYFTVLPRKCAGFEHSLVGLVVFETFGGRGRPNWVRLTAEEIADRLILTTEGAQQLAEGAVKKGLLERKKDGREYWYRAAVDAWEQIADREARKLEKKPPQEEEQVRSVAPAHANVVRPGARWIPEPIEEPTARYEIDLDKTLPIPLAFERKLVRGVCVISIRPGEENLYPSTGIRTEASDANTRTPVQVSAQAVVENKDFSDTDGLPLYTQIREWLVPIWREQYGGKTIPQRTIAAIIEPLAEAGVPLYSAYRGQPSFSSIALERLKRKPSDKVWHLIAQDAASEWKRWCEDHPANGNGNPAVITREERIASLHNLLELQASDASSLTADDCRELANADPLELAEARERQAEAEARAVEMVRDLKRRLDAARKRDDREYMRLLTQWNAIPEDRRAAVTANGKH